MLEKSGVAEEARLRSILPPETARSGPVAVVECFQPIPCDPCVEACPRQAIRPMRHIHDLPALDYSRCNGCGRCVFFCPGLAIFIVDESYREGEALVKLPYEMPHPPRKGEEGWALDRQGRRLCPARVERIQESPCGNKLKLLCMVVPGAYAHRARAWRRREEHAQS